MLMQPRQTFPRLEGKDDFLGSRRGLYTELPDTDPLIRQRLHHRQQIGAIGPAKKLSQFPAEGFSFAPGWALNADHFYQWQHRGKTTQQVLRKMQIFPKISHEEVLGANLLSSYFFHLSVSCTLEISDVELTVR